MIIIAAAGDLVSNEIPFWQQSVPYVCLAYTLLVLWYEATVRVIPYRVGAVRMKWLALIYLVPILGALIALYVFRYSKYRNISTVAERQEAERKSALAAEKEQKRRDTEAMESFQPFETSSES